MPARPASADPPGRPAALAMFATMAIAALAALAALAQAVCLGEDAGALAGYSVPAPAAASTTGASGRQATVTGILPMRVCHSLGPVSCTLVPAESTATVTGMSLTVNS